MEKRPLESKSFYLIHRLIYRTLALVYILISALGLFAFISSKSPSITPQIKTKKHKALAKKETNLAYFKNGTWLKASSYAWLYVHHPMFVIDGIREPPSNQEEWVPDRADKKPWLSLHLKRRSEITRIIVFHEIRYSKRSYIISCWRKNKLLKSQSSLNTRETRVVYPLKCKGADSVRIDFKWDPYDPQGHIRIFEIEVWGR
jgi:hypothetical protein